MISEFDFGISISPCAIGRHAGDSLTPLQLGTVSPLCEYFSAFDTIGSRYYFPFYDLPSKNTDT